MGMTLQVKRAIAQMKEAGFERSEFSCNVERKWHGKRGERYVEYGNAQIYLKSSDRTKLYRLLPNIVAVGLGVRMTQFEDGRWWVFITTKYEHEGKVEKVSYFGSDDEKTFVQYTTLNGNRTMSSKRYSYKKEDIDWEGDDD